MSAFNERTVRERFKNATDDDIAELEKLAGGTFSREYRSFLTTGPIGFYDHLTVDVREHFGTSSQPLVWLDSPYDSGTGITLRMEWRIEDTYELLCDDENARFVFPIGRTGFGDKIVIQVGEIPEIVEAVEKGPIGAIHCVMLETGELAFIASCFDEFIQQIRERPVEN